MQIVGVDFTSAPGPRKQITVVRARFSEPEQNLSESVARLTVLSLERLASFEAFEQFLQRPGESWFGGFDFPFALPAEFVRAQGWPDAWAAYVPLVFSLGKQGFESAVRQYQDSRPVGSKQCFRLTDRLTRSSSPLKLYYPPVGKMFFQGAARLLASGIAVYPQNPLSPASKHAVEAYPALIVRRVLGKKTAQGGCSASRTAPYKTDTPSQDTPERAANRVRLLKVVEIGEGLLDFQLQIVIPEVLKAEFLSDVTGDALDALLCTFQAAWAYRQGFPYGIPSVCDPNEGWIVDPDLAGGLEDLELPLPAADIDQTSVLAAHPVP